MQHSPRLGKLEENRRWEHLGNTYGRVKLKRSRCGRKDWDAFFGRAFSASDLCTLNACRNYSLQSSFLTAVEEELKSACKTTEKCSSSHTWEILLSSALRFPFLHLLCSLKPFWCFHVQKPRWSTSTFTWCSTAVHTEGQQVNLNKRMPPLKSSKLEKLDFKQPNVCFFKHLEWNCEQNKSNLFLYTYITYHTHALRAHNSSLPCPGSLWVQGEAP